MQIEYNFIEEEEEFPSLEDYLLTEVISLPGMTLDELREECDRMIIRNQQISKFYDGLRYGTLSKGEFEEFTDCLFETGYEPDEYIEEMQHNVGLLLKSGEFYAW